MSKRLFLCAIAIALATSPVHAAGVDIAWDHCVADGGVSNATLDCANPYSYRSAFMSFVSSVAMPRFEYLEYVLDVQVDAAVLPAFWNLQDPIGNPSGCNDDWIIGVWHSSACPSSLNAWIQKPGVCGSVKTSSASYQPGVGGPSRGRINATIGQGCHSDTVMIRPSYSYDFSSFQIFSSQAIEAGGACTGCSTPATLVLNQITLHWFDEANGVAPIVISGPGVGSNCITMNGGGVPCGATRGQPRTWGTLKALYR